MNEIQHAEHRHIVYFVKAHKERIILSLDALKSGSDQTVSLCSLKLEMPLKLLLLQNRKEQK